MINRKDMKPAASRSSLRNEFKTSRNMRGLSDEEAKSRLERFGPNELPKQKRKSSISSLISQFKSPLIVLLMAGAAVSMALGQVHDGMAIILILVLNAITGFVQEYRAEKAMEALRKMAAPTALVIRDGTRRKIPASELVPGDLVVIEAGDVIPADILLLEGSDIRVDESALTGESVPIPKSPVADTQSLDEKSMLFLGTTAVYGHGMGKVRATGSQTRFAGIAMLLEEAGEEKTPLQRRLDQLGRRLTVWVLGICVLVFLAGLLNCRDILELFLTSVSLAVAAVPEALPAIVTLSLALGARELARKKALARNLPAVETLGSVTCICSDKTGTITLNRMRVETILDRQGRRINGSDLPREFVLALALCNHVSLDAEGRLLGDPTETALVSRIRELGHDPEDLERQYPRVAEIPFSSERMCMTTIHRVPSGSFLALTKGSMEAVRKRCTGTSGADTEEMNRRLAEEGLRILAFSCRYMEKLPEHLEEAEEKMSFLGSVGLMDPPRPEVPRAISTCFMAGITPVMITGDHPATAAAIARRIGLLRPQDHSRAVTGTMLSAMDREELKQTVRDARIYARISPEQKLLLVSTLQETGQSVAMTGDGVNDAPALKQADIGVAMGINGTDVAKQASDLILLDDNFATIVRSVKIGRRIYDNIRKFLKYLLASNAAEILIIFLAPFLGLPMPLLPIQILWINLISDGAPCLGLVAEPAEADVMKRPPRPPDEGLFAKGIWQHLVWMAPFMTALCLGIQKIGLETGGHWQTMIFTALAFCQLAHVLAIRSDSQSIFFQGFLSNLPLTLIVAVTVAVQAAVVYIPEISIIMHTAPLSFSEMGLCVFAAMLIFAAVELEKLLLRRGIIQYRR